MTWKEIKDATLQLMFSYSLKGTALSTTDNANADFLLAMVAPANLCIRDLAGVCPIRREINLKQYEETNLASYEESDDGDEFVITGESAQSFYCEIDGDATVVYEIIQSDDTVVRMGDEAVSTDKYTPVRYVYDDLYDDVQVRIECDTANTRVRNYALYEKEYEDWEVPSPGDYQIYSLSEIITRESEKTFFKMADEKPVRLTNDDYYEYDISPYVRFDGKDVLIVPSSIEGEITVHYYAYPTAITAATLDAFEIEIDNEVADLIPYYVASVLYTEDNVQLAAMYKNEYYARRNALDPKGQTFGADEFINSSGW